MIRLSRWLAGNASLFIIAIAILTFFMPELFVWVRGTTQTVILGIIMLTMGLTLTTDDFRILARRPLDILLGTCAQFFIMPCVAYLLTRVFHLEPALALGILLVGCCPGGVSSNIMFKAEINSSSIQALCYLLCKGGLSPARCSPQDYKLFRHESAPQGLVYVCYPCRNRLFLELHLFKQQAFPHHTKPDARSQRYLSGLHRWRSNFNSTR